MCVVLCVQSTTPSPVKYQKIDTLAKVDAYKPFGSAQPRFVAGAEVSSHVGQAGLRLTLLACLCLCVCWDANTKLVSHSNRLHTLCSASPGKVL